MKKSYLTTYDLNAILIIIFILLFTGMGLFLYLDFRIDALEEEIATMPHYECHEESFKGFIDMNQTHICWGLEGANTCHAYYDGYSAICDRESKSCYVDDIKEVCEIVPKTDEVRK